jgi:hypothetical protein
VDNKGNNVDDRKRKKNKRKTENQNTEKWESKYFPPTRKLLLNVSSLMDKRNNFLQTFNSAHPKGI